MSNYQELIDRIVELICKNSQKEKDFIIIGDNSSGKSEVLYKVLKKKQEQPLYFIDSVNRTFDAEKVELLSKTYKNIKYEAKDVVNERLSVFNFNLRDTFHAASCIEQLFDKYSSKINTMCKMFLNRDIQITRENLEAGLAENKVTVDGIEMKLSSGYQAIIRLFCETLFFADALAANGETKGFLVIDEIDEYLSPKYNAQILNFLQEQFPEMNFLVTTHSVDLVKYSQNATLIVLHDLTYEIYAGQEIENIVFAEDIFTRLFFEENMIHKSDDDPIDEKLRTLLNLKIAGLWDEQAQKELADIDCEQILPHQKMICKQIKEW